MNEVVMVAVVSIITETFKRAGFPNRFLPMVALICGMSIGWFFLDGLPSHGIIQGVLIGGASMGIYRGGRVLLKGE